MYLAKYQGKTQNYDSDETLDASYDSNDEFSNYIKIKIHPLKILSLGEYYRFKNQSDSDDEILAWMNIHVFNVIIEVEQESEQESPYLTNSNEVNKNLCHNYLPSLQPPKSSYIQMNLGTKEH